MQVDIPASSNCLQSLIEASLGLPEHEWEVGWSLASYNNDSQPSKDFFQTHPRVSCSSWMCFLLLLWISLVYKFVLVREEISLLSNEIGSMMAETCCGLDVWRRPVKASVNRVNQLNWSPIARERGRQKNYKEKH